jgi:hypothetical protein
VSKKKTYRNVTQEEALTLLQAGCDVERYFEYGYVWMPIRDMFPSCVDLTPFVLSWETPMRVEVQEEEDG